MKTGAHSKRNAEGQQGKAEIFQRPTLCLYVGHQLGVIPPNCRRQAPERPWVLVLVTFREAVPECITEDGLGGSLQQEALKLAVPLAGHLNASTCQIEVVAAPSL